MLSERDGAAVWTGRELLIWGGMAPVAGERFDAAMRPGDGLAYDPARRGWRRLPPLPGSLPRRARPVGWTGRELLVLDTDPSRQVTGGGLRGAAYDPLSDHWRLLPASPALRSGRLLDRIVLWAGTRLLVWTFWTRPDGGTPGSLEPDGVDLWAYDPATDRWTVQPDKGGS